MRWTGGYKGRKSSPVTITSADGEVTQAPAYAGWELASARMPKGSAKRPISPELVAERRAAAARKRRRNSSKTTSSSKKPARWRNDSAVAEWSVGSAERQSSPGGTSRPTDQKAT